MEPSSRRILLQKARNKVMEWEVRGVWKGMLAVPPKTKDVSSSFLPAGPMVHSLLQLAVAMTMISSMECRCTTPGLAQKPPRSVPPCSAWDDGSHTFKMVEPPSAWFL